MSISEIEASFGAFIANRRDFFDVSLRPNMPSWQAVLAADPTEF